MATRNKRPKAVAPYLTTEAVDFLAEGAPSKTKGATAVLEAWPRLVGRALSGIQSRGALSRDAARALIGLGRGRAPTAELGDNLLGLASVHLPAAAEELRPLSPFERAALEWWVSVYWHAKGESGAPLNARTDWVEGHLDQVAAI